MSWQKGKKLSRKHRNKIRKSITKHYSNPAARSRMSKIKLKHYKENPKTIKKIDRAITAWWRDHPHVKKKRSEQVKQFFIKNPAKFKKFLRYGKNPSRLILRTKQGFKVRSRGEQKIANFLHKNKIKCTYEQHTLFFKKEGQLCTPDFYLPAYKVLIEYYGGHPKSWKKKVLKNKIYKAHSIPCIFITPAELRNLGYYLLQDAEKIGKTKLAKSFKLAKWVK